MADEPNEPLDFVARGGPVSLNVTRRGRPPVVHINAPQVLQCTHCSAQLKFELVEDAADLRVPLSMYLSMALDWPDRQARKDRVAYLLKEYIDARDAIDAIKIEKRAALEAERRMRRAKRLEEIEWAKAEQRAEEKRLREERIREREQMLMNLSPEYRMKIQAQRKEKEASEAEKLYGGIIPSSEVAEALKS